MLLVLLVLSKKVEPDEIYNLGAQSHVKVSFEMPEYTAQVDAIGTLRILEAVRLCWYGEEDTYLSSIYIRTVWIGSGSTSDRDYSFSSTFSIWSC